MIPFKTIVLTTDLSDNAAAALPYAVALAKLNGATIHLFHALEHEQSEALAAGVVIGVSAWIASQRKEREEKIAALAKEIESTYGVKVVGVAVLGHPAKEAARYAKSHQADLVVIATHGRSGVSHLLLGSIAERVVRLSEAPVLTVRPGMPLVKAVLPTAILLPTDFSESAAASEPYAIELCKQYDAKILLTYVVEDSVYFATAADGTMGYGFDTEEWIKSIADEADKRLRKKAAELNREFGVTVETVRMRGTPAEQICQAAKDSHADLIAISTHGHTGLSHLAFGSIAEKVVRISSVPVLSIKPA